MSERIAQISLDESSIRHRSAEVEHERSVAMADLRGDNLFEPVGMCCGPYNVRLSIVEHRLALDIQSENAEHSKKITLSVQPLKRIIRDYFIICESYYEALKNASTGKIEAIDMGRRGVHNEGSEQLISLLEGKVKVDFPTARRLFTLICVLHIK